MNSEKIMELFEAIHIRQDTRKFKSDPIPRALIERMLAAAVQAPNHHRVRPWRFVVLTGSARERLGEVMAQSMRKRDPGAMDEALAVERARPVRAPVVIAVGVDPPRDPKVIEIENVCAAAAATQNLMLAACGLGLATMWRTGAAARDPEVKACLGFEPDQPLIGFIYVGFPLAEPSSVTRPSFEDRTVWME